MFIIKRHNNTVGFISTDLKNTVFGYKRNSTVFEAATAIKDEYKDAVVKYTDFNSTDKIYVNKIVHRINQIDKELYKELRKHLTTLTK